MTTRHPVQPLQLDANGVLRFKGNAIVRHLLDAGPFDLNVLAEMDFSREDREQFAQLIGYSLSGFGDLSYASDEVYETAEAMHERGLPESEARSEFLRAVLEEVTEHLRHAATVVFGIHPDDLRSKVGDAP